MEICPIDHENNGAQGFSLSTSCCITHQSHLTRVSQPQALVANEPYHSQHFFEHKSKMTGVEYRAVC
jgi:hypothetical protein